MVSSVLLCSLKNSNTQIKSYFQSSPPPLSVTQFRLNGQCWVRGKVSDGGGTMVIVLVVGNATSFLCFWWLCCSSQAWHLLSATALIRGSWLFVILCHIHIQPRKEFHTFILTNQFLLFSDILAPCRSHVLLDSTEVKGHIMLFVLAPTEEHNMSFDFPRNSVVMTVVQCPATLNN